MTNRTYYRTNWTYTTYYRTYMTNRTYPTYD